MLKGFEEIPRSILWGFEVNPEFSYRFCILSTCDADATGGDIGCACDAVLARLTSLALERNTSKTYKSKMFSERRLSSFD